MPARATLRGIQIRPNGRSSAISPFTGSTSLTFIMSADSEQWVGCRRMTIGARPVSENEFQRHLHQARRGSPDDLAKELAVEVAVDGHRSEKLRVIKRIERLQPELQRLRFRQAERSQQREVEIQRAGTVKAAPRCAARSAEGVRAEQREVEVRHCVARIVIQL